MLFNGPQLATGTGKYTMTHYVNLARVFEVINMVMYKLPIPELDQLKNLLKNRSIERLNKIQLESSYALRVMVEYYRREKKCKYVALLAMMDQMYD